MAWSRSVRRETHHGLHAKAAALQGLKDQIEIIENELADAKQVFRNAQASVTKYKTELRILCLEHDLEERSEFMKDANSSGEEYEFDCGSESGSVEVAVVEEAQGSV